MPFDSSPQVFFMGMPLSSEDGKTFHLHGDFHLKVHGKLTLEGTEHTVVLSGNTPDPNRQDGIGYSVWLNPTLDGNGNPIQRKPSYAPFAQRLRQAYPKKHGRSCSCKTCR